jgi:predicted nuclease with TOPRIM domain
MTLSYTQHTLEKLESLLKSLGFKLRYEKGNFKTGSCVLENNRVILVNKYSNLESKINALADLLQRSETEDTLLEDKQKAFLYELKQLKLEL